MKDVVLVVDLCGLFMCLSRVSMVGLWVCLVGLVGSW